MDEIKLKHRDRSVEDRAAAVVVAVVVFNFHYNFDLLCMQSL
jgi:hypothetical protein